jgi:hypothetical protein
MTKPSEKDEERARHYQVAFRLSNGEAAFLAAEFAAVREEGRVAGLEEAAEAARMYGSGECAETAIRALLPPTTPDAGKTSEGVAPLPGGRASGPGLHPPGGGSEEPGTTSEAKCTCDTIDLPPHLGMPYFKRSEHCPVHGSKPTPCALCGGTRRVDDACGSCTSPCPACAAADKAERPVTR